MDTKQGAARTVMGGSGRTGDGRQLCEASLFLSRSGRCWPNISEEVPVLGMVNRVICFGGMCYL